MKYLCVAHSEYETGQAFSWEEAGGLRAKQQFGHPGDVSTGGRADSDHSGRMCDSASGTARTMFTAPFCIIDAADMDHAVRLVARTPWAHQKATIEVRPVTEVDAGGNVGVE
jgi:hypothetical protein